MAFADSGPPLSSTKTGKRLHIEGEEGRVVVAEPGGGFERQSTGGPAAAGISGVVGSGTKKATSGTARTGKLRVHVGVASHNIDF